MYYHICYILLNFSPTFVCRLAIYHDTDRSGKNIHEQEQDDDDGCGGCK